MNTASASSRWSMPGLRLLFAGLLLAVAGTFTLTAFARPGHGPHGGGMFMGRALEHMLDSVNATEAQRAQIKQIAEAARNDLKAQREARKSLHEQGLQVFTQPNVDANAAEALRQQMLAQHDQASRRMMQAMLDISRVLTPEQRQQLAQKLKQRHEMMQRHMHERQQLDKTK